MANKQAHRDSETIDTLTPFCTITSRLLAVPKAEVDDRDRKWRESKAEKRGARETKKAEKA